VSFVEAVRVCFSKYVTFTGRARRSEYWWFVLFGGLVYIVAAILSSAASSSVFVVIAVLALLLPTLAVLVRRLHDTSRSGWWYFISLVPLVGGIFLLVYLASDSTPGSNEYGEHHQGGYLEGSQYPGGPYPGGQFQGQPPALVKSGPNLNRNDLVVLGAGALMLVVSLLPWYGASYLGSSISTTAWDAGVGAWGSVILVVAVAGVAAVRAFGGGVFPGNSAVIWNLVTAAVSGLAVLFILLRWATYPDPPSFPGFSAGAKFGTYLGLILAVVQAVFGTLLIVSTGQLPWARRAA
jgi:uncharacterized membrane protein YhaH (DUF805 family)